MYTVEDGNQDKYFYFLVVTYYVGHLLKLFCKGDSSGHPQFGVWGDTPASILVKSISDHYRSDNWSSNIDLTHLALQTENKICTSANNIDLDETAHYDQDPHCLPFSF